MKGIGIKLQLKVGWNVVGELSAPLDAIAEGKMGSAIRALTGLCFDTAQEHLAPYQGRMAADSDNKNTNLGVTIKLLDLDTFSSDKPIGGCDMELRNLTTLAPGELIAWQESVLQLHEHLMSQATHILRMQSLFATAEDADTDAA